MKFLLAIFFTLFLGSAFAFENVIFQGLLGLEAFELAPSYIGAQDAAAHAGLGLGNHFASDPDG
jgi:hypothetical protein